MNYKEFIEFLESDRELINFKNKDGFIYVVIKFKHDENAEIVYISSNYNSLSVRNVNDFKYSGFYSRTTKQYYDMNFYSRSALNIEEIKTKSFEDLTNELKSEISKEILKISNDEKKRLLKTVKKDDCINRISNNAREKFFLHIKQVEFKPYFSNSYLSDSEVISFVNNNLSIIDKAKEIINSSEDEFAEYLYVYLKTQIELNKLYANEDGTHYKQKEIESAVKDKVTVNVTILKDGIPLTFKTKANSLNTYCNCYLKYHIITNSGKYERLFDGKDYTADEIVYITYSKKRIYENKELLKQYEKVISN